MNIVYITVNLLDTSKCYVGLSTIDNPHYKGSGNAIKKALKELGSQNFKRFDLGSYKTVKIAHYYEKFFINYLKTTIKDGGYNICASGGTYNGKHSIESITKMIETHGLHNKNRVYKTKS
jgi:predicted membrane-bound spermidine synthase